MSAPLLLIVPLVRVDITTLELFARLVTPPAASLIVVVQVLLLLALRDSTLVEPHAQIVHQLMRLGSLVTPQLLSLAVAATISTVTIFAKAVLSTINIL